ncbi:cell separation during budding [Conoideocrella luteorostrata]|uniref:Cell separation during budding n=1 Tax=Conoideocrella luteorostrata TaxID=1105319 RepID=A0AAJ0CWH0_9HYPO|nr:cell separation during budding [Conoideocrella luteorostrata]
MDSSPSVPEGPVKGNRDPASPKQPTFDSSPTGGSIHVAAAPQRTPSLSNISKSAHRQSFAENLRNVPQSPRHRHPSFTQAAVQELLNHPPSGQRHANSKFAGREWGEITVGELVSPDDVKWIDMDSSVEEATMALLKSKTNVVLLREGDSDHTAIATFDYSDLNAYLLVVVGLSKPEPQHIQLYNEIMLKAREGNKILLRQIQPFCKHEPLVGVPSNDNLFQAVEILGGGIHRLLVTSSLGDVIGIMSQLRMVDFFWNEGVNFPSVDRLYPILLRDLGIGVQQIISVNSDASLSNALTLMNDEGLTSVAVVDNGQNVVGNISTKDVRHLTTTSSAPLLSESCMHFLSVILNERGVEKGRDAFPVFYVTPLSTLAHVVGKLTATRSHRMWIVEPISPSPSAPVTPMPGPQSVVSGSSAPAAAMPGAHLSGKLSGVISLTDILNTFAKFAGLHPTDPGEQRARRRRSSSSSIRPSLDSSRPSIDFRR